MNSLIEVSVLTVRIEKVSFPPCHCHLEGCHFLPKILDRVWGVEVGGLYFFTRQSGGLFLFAVFVLGRKNLLRSNV